jgi:hypothetical protein
MPKLSVMDSQGEHLYCGVKVDVTSTVYVYFMYLRLFLETKVPMFLHYSSSFLMVQYICVGVQAHAYLRNIKKKLTDNQLWKTTIYTLYIL